jgi:hypothetical protein
MVAYTFALLFVTTFFRDTEFLFLTRAPGARQVAMGSAFTAVADDAMAVYYNPAGLAFCHDTAFAFMNPTSLVFGVPKWLPGLYPGMKHVWVGGAMPISEQFGSIGVAWSYAPKGEWRWQGPLSGKLYRWNPYNYSVTISYGTKTINKLGVGVSLKYVYGFVEPEELAKEYGQHGGTASTIALDCGILYKTPVPGLSLGTSCQNMGSPGISWFDNEERRPIPSLIRSGAAFDASDLLQGLIPRGRPGLRIAADLIRDLAGNEHENWYAVGVEVAPVEILALRIGYFADKLSKRVGPTYGCGIALGRFQIEVASDAYIWWFLTSNWRLQVNYTHR